MGVQFDAGMNQDYSYLFQGLSSSSGGSMGNLNMLSDYAAIKNGSYGKLMKAYYGSAGSSSVSSSGKRTGTNNVLEEILEAKKYPKVSKEAQEANSKLSAGISSLTNAVSTLQNADTYSVLEDGKSAADKVVSAVKSFVSQYNDVVAAAKDSTLTRQVSHVSGMMRSSEKNADKLAEIGITINRDGTLQLNEGKLKETDISKVQELFSKDDIISYGSTVMSRLGFASASAGSADSTEKTETDAEQSDVTYSGAAALKEDIAKLTSGSLFEKIKDGNGGEKYDVDSIFAAAKSFVGNYNSMLEKAGRSFNSGVMANLATILEKTAKNKEALEEFGISVGAKGKLKIDEDAFRKADMGRLQKFFEEYGSSIASNVSLVNYYMTTQADPASGYTAGGTYNAQESFRYDVTQ